MLAVAFSVHFNMNYVKVKLATISEIMEERIYMFRVSDRETAKKPCDPRRPPDVGVNVKLYLHCDRKCYSLYRIYNDVGKRKYES